jgi:LCP family protein required for cell wall assembly
MRHRGALVPLVAAFALVAACSGDPGTTATEPPSATSTTASPPTVAATTTTTIRPLAHVEVVLPGASEKALEAIEFLYDWLADRRRPEPGVPDGLLEHLAVAPETGDLTLQGTWSSAKLPDRDDVGVAVFGEDVILLVGDDLGWRIVGAKVARLGLGAWYGDPVRHVLLLGTDARPGTPPLEARADSIHILSSNVGERTGAIVGFPRDSYVEGPSDQPASPEGRTLKFTHANYWFGPDGMVQIAEQLTGLDFDGYVVTGFLGFTGLVDAFGGVPVDVPFAMAEPNSRAYLDPGLQNLLGDDALAFSRNRHLPGIDFRRSLDQGLVVAGALGKIQSELGPADLPSLLAMLLEFTLTDMDAETLLTVAAGAFEVDPATIPDVVLSGRGTTRNTQYVVLLDDGVSGIFADLQDGMLTDPLPPGTLTSDG